MRDGVLLRAALARYPANSPEEALASLRANGHFSVTRAEVLRLWARLRQEDSLPWRGPVLYAWQDRALEAWESQGRCGVVEAVTGTGKTVVAAHAVYETILDGGQALILVPTIELLRQWQEVLARVLPSGLRIEVHGDGQKASFTRADVVISVVNSARAGLRPRHPRSLLVADECHRYATEHNHRALDEAFERRLGLSATYARDDGAHKRHLNPYFGEIVYRMGYALAAAEGVVAPFAVALLGVLFTPDEAAEYRLLTARMAALILRFREALDPTLGPIEAVVALARGSGEEAEAARRFLRDANLRRQLLDHVQGKHDALVALAPIFARMERALVFSRSIAAAEESAAALAGAGLRAVSLHSGLDRAERSRRMEAFRAGQLEVLCAPQILDEGVDVPDAALAVLWGATRTARPTLQRLGRILRPKANGQMAHFILLFVEGTVEDPARGAHARFLGEVIEAARAIATFGAGDPPHAIAAFFEEAAWG